MYIVGVATISDTIVLSDISACHFYEMSVFTLGHTGFVQHRCVCCVAGDACSTFLRAVPPAIPASPLRLSSLRLPQVAACEDPEVDVDQTVRSMIDFVLSQFSWAFFLVIIAAALWLRAAAGITGPVRLGAPRDVSADPTRLRRAHFA